MAVLIDGNNLLYAALEADPERPPSRSTLCFRLSQWARRTGEKVAVIFDGREPGKPLARQTSGPDISVRYSGAGVTADELLAEVIDADSAARRLLVVSSDREVARAAKRRRAKTMPSDAFWARLQRDLARPVPGPLEPREKRRGLETAETESWVREFGLGRPDPDRQGPARE